MWSFEMHFFETLCLLSLSLVQVEQIKERKRSSRREKERQKLMEQEQQLHQPQQPPLLEEPSDSWV